MRKLGSAVTIALALFSVVASLFGSSGPSAANEAIRFVPQLELTDLSPVKVVFAPDDDTLLMVVNSHGRVDIFDISNPGRPVKITEIAAGAADAAFTPKGTPREKVKIVSGGADGTVRLWMLDGKPAAEPFKGHDGPVRSVAFSSPTARASSPAAWTAPSGCGCSTASQRPSPSRDIGARSGASPSRPTARASSPVARTAPSGCGRSTARPRPNSNMKNEPARKLPFSTSRSSHGKFLEMPTPIAPDQAGVGGRFPTKSPADSEMMSPGERACSAELSSLR